MLRSISICVLTTTLVLVGGCTTTYQWAKSDATPESEMQDVHQCRSETDKKSDRAFESCMAAKGYRMKQKTGWHSPAQ